MLKTYCRDIQIQIRILEFAYFGQEVILNSNMAKRDHDYIVYPSVINKIFYIFTDSEILLRYISVYFHNQIFEQPFGY